MGMMMIFGGFFSKTDAVFSSSSSSAKKRLVSDGYSIELDESTPRKNQKGCRHQHKQLKTNPGILSRRFGANRPVRWGITGYKACSRMWMSSGRR